MKANISPNLTFGEATISNTAKSRGIKNEPSDEILENMRHVARTVFQILREHFKGPLFVSSFFRCPDLNKAIGGSPTSQHCRGEAMDIDGDVYPTASNVQIFEYIKDNCDSDQLILEGISSGKVAWVHVSSKKYNNRKKILLMYRQNGRTIYENYSDKRYRELVY